jgi:ectoine hydroxylase-related dioxygenase (phytanoyl-CoA dioxygenase family)
VNVLKDIDRDGFAIVPGVLSEHSRLEFLDEAESLLQESPAGVRGLAAKVHSVGALAQSAAVRSLVDSVLGAYAQLVRSILFNKSDEANWQVAWHQDLAIAVSEKVEVEGYSSWSVKDGVPHVQPPEEILEQMLTVRLHLDPADETNGALWVSPGSHRLGRLRAADAAGVAERNGKHLCRVGAGDALLLRPLILHASRKTISSVPRRVIHLEFAGASLPSSLAWAEAAA